ncbi:MAG TPA: prolyl oligopeptidase family serine peptidase [Caulobacteraceae bacterium]|nr:prolyl oligopeptidase family serine peptidase [Caulobacteraceae bacterium]
MSQSIDRRALLASSAALAGALAAPRFTFAQTPAGGPPVAPVRPVTETLWGVEVTDPYRWMEQQGPEWKAYALAENDYARKMLAAIPGRDALYAAISKNSGAIVALAGAQVAGDYVFSEVRPAQAESFKLYVRNGLDGADRLLLDPDRFAPPGSHAAIDHWVASPDGKHLVFGVSPGGSEASVAHIMVTDTGELLPETIDRTEDASSSWTDDGSGFFYNRLQGGLPPDSLDKFKLSACWFHKLGSDPASDIKVLAKGTSPDVDIADIDFPVVATTTGSDVAVGLLVSGVQNELSAYAASVADARAGKPNWRRICTPADNVTDLAVHGDDIYLQSHDGASRYKVLRTTAAQPDVTNAKLVVPESASVIRGIGAARDGLYITDLNAGLGGIRRLAWDGTLTTVPMPFDGALGGVFVDTANDGCWFELEGWAKPPTVFYIAPDGKVTETNLAPKPAIDASSYTSEETFCTAADGVKVPLSIVYKQGLKRDGSATLLLDAYGSYGITEDPGFLARFFPFLDLGGVFATAHVRGGGELGEDWHLAGKKATKPNTWGDDIAAAEYLIAQGYTSKSKLAIVGGSAGGITVGRFMTERPDLAAVVIDQVGSSNTLRAEFSPNGPPNIPEFGTVTVEADFKPLYEMDAYQHVRDGVAYPSVLLTTGLNDPRVSSWEPTKMTARLQAATASKNPIILRVETDAGHGIGSTRDQRDRETADEIAFIMWRTGDARFQPTSS